MSRRIASFIAGVALVAGFAGCKRSPQAADEAAGGLDPSVAQRMQAMSDLMKSTQTFSFKTVEDQHRVRANGQERDEHYTREVIVHRPDGLWFHRVKEGKSLYVWYDGKTLTARSDSLKVYAQLDMPPTLDEGFDYLASTFHFPMPMGDILYSDPYAAFIGDSTRGKIVGDEEIGGVKCQHLAFTDPVVDFEVWVENGQRPLPCRVNITYKTLDGPPRASITFSDWNLSPQVPPDQFTASVPSDYRRIPVVGVTDSTAAPADGAAPDEADTSGTAAAEPQPSAGASGADTSSP
jgi:hypothetical protein